MMRLPVPVYLVAASAALLAVLASCSGDSDAPSEHAAALDEPAAAPAHDRQIVMAQDLVPLGEKAAAAGIPVVLLVSQTGCQYCAALRREVLHPMMRAGIFDSRAILAEVSLDPGYELSDFSGESVAGARFAARYAAYVTPTVLVLGSDGESLSEPLVGTRNLEMYGFYLERAIDEATETLRSRPLDESAAD